MADDPLAHIIAQYITQLIVMHDVPTTTSWYHIHSRAVR